MITFNTPRLLEKGITEAYIELDPDTSKIGHSVNETLEKHHFGPEDAQPFIVNIYAYDLTNRKVALGTAEGVHHKKIPPMFLDDDYRDCRELLFLTMVFIEKPYEKCGIATSVLDYLPKLVDTEMGGSIDAIFLSPVPQYKNTYGKITQLPFGVEFLIKYKELLVFYSKRNFSICDSLSFMGRRTSIFGMAQYEGL